MKNTPQLITLLAFALMVGWFSLQPGGNSAIGSYDKLAHFVTYAVFAILAYRLGLGPMGFFCCAVLIVIYSALLEFGQSFIPGRMMSGLDLVANTAGVVMGAIVCRMFASRLPPGWMGSRQKGNGDD